MREKKELRELSQTELQTVAGGVTLGGIAERVAVWL